MADGLFGGVFGGDDGPDWAAEHVTVLGRGELEELVEALLADEGYRVERAAPNAEGGVALTARKGGLIGSRSLVVAVSPAGQTVTPASVRQLDRGRGINGADAALLVRQGEVPDAVREAAPTNVELLDLDALVARLARSGLAPPDPET